MEVDGDADRRVGGRGRVGDDEPARDGQGRSDGDGSQAAHAHGGPRFDRAPVTGPGCGPTAPLCEVPDGRSRVLIVPPGQDGGRTRRSEADVAASVLYMSMSLDGFIDGPTERPGGEAIERLHRWIFPGAEPGDFDAAGRRGLAGQGSTTTKARTIRSGPSSPVQAGLPAAQSPPLAEQTPAGHRIVTPPWDPRLRRKGWPRSTRPRPTGAPRSAGRRVRQPAPTCSWVIRSRVSPLSQYSTILSSTTRRMSVPWKVTTVPAGAPAPGIPPS